jgi:D-threo-aldose 1-dehydrogenase
VLPTREIVGTEIATSAIGLGCAGLFRLPQRNARRLVLDAAYDSGIRHFDVAPMYGLGLAEAELASFLKRRRSDVTVTTKFGIEPTLLSHGVARVQSPVRALLAKRPSVGDGLKVAGQGPRSGSLGHLLYRAPGYSRQSAKRALERSLRVLDTDHIDIFLLHDPIENVVSESPGLVDYLNEQRDVGRIRAWGVTGQASEIPGIVKTLGQDVVTQFRDDVFDPPLTEDRLFDGARITYGALARALPRLRAFLRQSPDDTRVWSKRLEVDLTEAASLPNLLLSAALRRNPAGPVLFSTTHAERVWAAVEALIESENLPDAQLATISELAAAASRGRVETIGKS